MLWKFRQSFWENFVEIMDKLCEDLKEIYGNFGENICGNFKGKKIVEISKQILETFFTKKC